MKSSTVVKRSIVIGGHKTSVSLEDAFWTGLKNIAHAHRMTVQELVSKIDGTRDQSNLSSAIRLFVLHHFRNLFVVQHLPNAVEGTDVATAHLAPMGAERQAASANSPTSQISSIK